MIDWLISLYSDWVAGGSVALALVARLYLGAFFLLSGWHKMFNAARRCAMRATFKEDGVSLSLVGFVICWELLGGAMVLLGAFSAVGLIALSCVCVVACLTDGLKRIKEMVPIDRADWFDDLLYLPETGLAVAAAVLLLNGPSIASVDWLLIRWLT